MKLRRVDKFRIKYNELQHAYFTTVAKRYTFCLNLLSEWLYFYINKRNQEWFDLLEYKIFRNDYSMMKGFPYKLYMHFKNQLPTSMNQNLFREALQIARSRRSMDKIYHSRISYFGFTYTNISKSNSNVFLLPRSKYLRKCFPKVYLTIPQSVINHLKSETNRYHFQFRFINGQWWCYINKQINVQHDNTTKERIFAAIDLNMNDIAFIDEVTKQPVLLSLKHIIWKSIKLFKKYQKAQSCNNNKLSKVYRYKIKRLFEETFKLYAIRIIQHCKSVGVNRLAIGSVKPTLSKKELSRMLRRLWNMIPWTYFIDYLKHYGEKFGIFVYKINEAYTSKASALDNDPLPERKSSISFSGRRISRGLYQTSDGTVIHADVNASANILRRAAQRFNKAITFTKNQLSAVRRVGCQLLNQMKLSEAIEFKKLKDYIANPGKFYTELVRLVKSSHRVPAFQNFMLSN